MYRTEKYEMHHGTASAVVIINNNEQLERMVVWSVRFLGFALFLRLSVLREWHNASSCARALNSYCTLAFMLWLLRSLSSVPQAPMSGLYVLHFRICMYLLPAVCLFL